VQHAVELNKLIPLVQALERTTISRKGKERQLITDRWLVPVRRGIVIPEFSNFMERVPPHRLWSYPTIRAMATLKQWAKIQS